ncbi:hypothetical protein ACTJIV_07065 [Chryseobacterium sp. 22532]|uniref:hypothetical protein n=1 Tax=Chryseobacterium sp. 22532 TaxID=3453938 RepID=UPI003F853C7E
MSIGAALFTFHTATAQVRFTNRDANSSSINSSAFIDASSAVNNNATSNVGKGLLYPRTDLSTFTAFGGSPVGIPNSYPTFYDGFVVYNTKVGDTAGVGATQGTLTAGFWYYDNKSKTINGGTWKPLGENPGNTSDTSIYNANGTLNSNRTVGLSGKILNFEGPDPIIGFRSTSANASEIFLHRDNNGTNIPAGQYIGKLNFSGKVEGVNRYLAGISSVYQGNGTTQDSELRFSVNGESNNQLSLDNQRLFANTRIGIKTSSPTEELDVNGNVRFRGVTETSSIAATDRFMLLGEFGVGKRLSLADLKTAIGPDNNTNIYNANGTLNSNRTVGLNGKILNFDGPDPIIGFRSTSANASEIFLHRDNNGTNIPAGQYIGKLNFSGKVGGVNTYLASIRAAYQGNGITTASELRFSVGGETSTELILNKDGNLGVGNITPSQKLDVDGNARLRNVPNGNLNVPDRYVAIDGNGNLKKVDIDLPAFGLYAQSNSTVTRYADNVARPLVINDYTRINSIYVTRINGNTFRAEKDGIYTIEVWAYYSNIPPADGPGGDVTRGCSMKLDIPSGGAVQKVGDRWADNTGTNGFTRTKRLQNGEIFSVSTRCIRNGSQTYQTAPGSSIMVTYLPSN